MYKYPHVVVVGAGIVGASLAYHLTCLNARVTLIEKATKPGSAVTEKSFGWINAGHDESKTYLKLRQLAIEDWRRVEKELAGQLAIDWSGALTWRENSAETESLVRKLLDVDYQVRLVDEHEINLLEPNLKNAPTQAMFAKNEGAINPLFVTKLFIKAAQKAGADIQLGNEVLSLIIKGSHIAGVVTANGKWMADFVVLATGADTTAMYHPLGLSLPLHISPAILVAFQNMHRFVNGIVSNPLMEIRAASNTLTLAAEDYIDDSIENNPQAIAYRTLKQIKKHWRGTENIKLANVNVGKRPIPKDGLPVIGRPKDIEGLYLLVMHSGVTLAAIAGRLAAAEIVNDCDDSLLSSYRPDRFT